MLVSAKCIMFAWDSGTCQRYEPGKGPLEDGNYEIDTGSRLAELTVGTSGEWVFQYPGHTGGPDKTAKPGVEPVKAPPVAARKADNRKVPMSEERKAKLRKALADARAAKRARLEAA